MTFFVEQLDDLSRHSPTQVLFDTFQVVPWLGTIQLDQSWQEKKPNPNQNLKWIHILKRKHTKSPIFPNWTAISHQLQENSRMILHTSRSCFTWTLNLTPPSVGCARMNGPGNVRVIMGVRSSAHYPVPATDPGQAQGWFPSTVRRDWLGWLVGWVSWLVGLSKSTFSCSNIFLFFTFFLFWCEDIMANC